MEEFVFKHLELLTLEREEEISENSKQYHDVNLKELERRGICILKLRISSRFTGFYGRFILSFEPFWPGKNLPAHKITNGDIVGLYYYHKDNIDLSNPLASGVVIKNEKNGINVAFDLNFDQLDLDDDVQYQLLKLTNEISYRRIKNALKDLRKGRCEPSSHLIDVLFHNSIPSDPLNIIKNEFQFFNQSLDESQEEAVKFALNQKEIAIVHGPPGTGKTTTVIEIILQANKLGQKILACAPSNVAVDNLVERLADYNINMIRLGHPARFMSKVQPYALDAVLSNSNYGDIIKDVRKDIDDLRKHRRKENKSMREMNFLYKELRNRETKATKELLEKSSVILSTLTSAYLDGPLKHLKMDHFDLVVIDECSQGLEAACWIPLLRAPKCILAGDHLQLPPTIVSKKAAEEGLSLSLMERQIKIHGDKIVRMLTTQYRMHQLIMEWSSQTLYNNKLKAHSSVVEHLLKDLPNVIEGEDSLTPLLFIDTAGCNIFELDLANEASKGNEGEADIAATHVRNLISCGVKQNDIALVTPYNLQIELLRLRLSNEFPGVEIRSVDGFQGREKEAVVMTLVRSNEKGEIGFLAEIRRMNVAITRARRHLTIICDSETVSHDPQLKTFIEFLNSHAEIRSAHQYEDVISKSTFDKPSNLQFKKTEKLKSKSKKKKNEISQKEKVENEKKIVDEAKSNERNLAIYNKIEAEIMGFLNDTEAKSYSFSTKLSSYERRIVHEISEKFNLNHSSVGENDERRIVISKMMKNLNLKNKKIKKTKTNCNKMVFEDEIEVEHNSDDNINDVTVEDEANDDIKCIKCLHNVPKLNYELHLIHCHKAIEDISKQPKKQKKSKQKIEKEEINGKSDPTDDDFDKLLKQFTAVDRKCNFPKCKTLTATLGTNCDFCRRRFCYSHGLPEVHGCGEEARKSARRCVLKEGKLYNGSGVPVKKIDPVKRSHLERKLDKKINELTNARKTKSKE